MSPPTRSRRERRGPATTRSHTAGDSHNFGRRVIVEAHGVTKPRTVFWEWLLLSAESPLRTFLTAAAERDGLGPDTFGFLPELEFWLSRTGVAGKVERVSLAPLPAASNEGKRALAAVVGRALALFSWLGLGDLHWENLVLGVDGRDRVVFGPLDVEMILANLSLPTETKLLPDADPEYGDVCRHACGVRRVLPYLGKPVDPANLIAIVAAYRGTLDLLDRHARDIADVFSRLPALRTAPIRVCLRGTDVYVRSRSEELWPPLLEAEAEQLARGDIPYFFRLYGRRGIHYYGDRTLHQIETLPSRGDVPRLDPLMSLARGLRAPSRKSLREQGLFAVLGAFDHASFSGLHLSDGFTVMFGQRQFAVTLPTGEELRARRNLGAFVSSIYLPCRCGEVRTVFVPPVTRCRSRLSGSAQRR